MPKQPKKPIRPKTKEEPKKKGRLKKDKPIELTPRVHSKEIDTSKVKKGRVGHPAAFLDPSKRKVCGAIANKRGKCEDCGHVPTPDENDHYESHHGKCEKCGGKMRCQVYILMPNGRCRLHGGYNRKGIAAAAYKHGLAGRNGDKGYAKYLPINLAEVYNEIQKEEERLSVQKEVDLLETFIRDLLPRMKGSELWDKAEIILRKLEKGSVDLDNAKKFKNGKEVIEKAVGDLRKLVRSGHNDADLRKELRGIMEDKSRIASREARRQLEQRMHMSVEEGTALLGAMARIVMDTTGSLPVMLSEKIRSEASLTVDLVEDKVIECLKEMNKNIAYGLQSLMHTGASTQYIEEDKDPVDGEVK